MLKQLLQHNSLLKVLTNVTRVLGVSSLIASLIVSPAYSQSNHTYRKLYRIHRVPRTQIRIRPRYRQLYPGNGPIDNISGVTSYPYGSQLYSNGTVQTSNGRVVPPSATVNHGDGTTSYYYSNGSRIDTYNNSIPPTGIYMR